MKDLHTKDLYLHTIGPLMSLQGFINNEIAKHKSLGDEYSVNHWRAYGEKIELLEAAHYTRYMHVQELVA